MNYALMPHRVFVYGTLKRGECRAHVMAGQRFLRLALTKPLYRLYSVREAFPALVEAARSDVRRTGLSIEGEVYEVDVGCLRELDVIEGVGAGLFERRRVELRDDMGDVEAYFWRGGIEGMKDIGGRW